MTETTTHSRDGINDTQLRSVAERLVRLHSERKSLADDIADVLKEAQSNGYDKPALKAVVKIMMEDESRREKRRETDDVLSVYCSALGLA